jgi:hypothetical protein
MYKSAFFFFYLILAIENPKFTSFVHFKFLIACFGRISPVKKCLKASQWHFQNKVAYGKVMYLF